MSGVREEEVAAPEQHRAVNVVGAVVSVVAAVFLGGGFYYGMTKQQKALAEEEKNAPKSKKKFEPKSSTFFERRLALDKQLPPSTAARKALLGVTLVSVTGCCLLVGGLASALGVSDMTELRDRRQKTPAAETKPLDFQGLGEAKREILKEVVDEVKKEK
ncbi:hypothetical protein PRIC1_011356 [Phytophthora ramorum]